MKFAENIKASKAIGADDFDTAIQIYKKRIENDETDIVSLKMIANCYCWKDDDENSFYYATKALKIEPEDFNMHFLVAMYWLSRKENKNVYKSVSLALENPPEVISKLPKLTILIVKLIGCIFWFKKKNLSKSIDDYCNSYNEENEAKLKWAREFKDWYESNTENMN